MLYFASFKEHYSLFAASGTFFAALEDELRGYELRKGTVHFPLTKPVPVKLISRIAKLRAAGIAARTKNRYWAERKKNSRENGVAVAGDQIGSRTAATATPRGSLPIMAHIRPMAYPFARF
jgi:hypothetical protein